MQRLCTKLRSLALQSNQTLNSLAPSRRLLHPKSSQFHQSLHSACRRWNSTSVIHGALSITGQCPPAAISSLSSTSGPHYFVQARYINTKERKQLWKKKWRPRTPVISKVKKIKMKSYSSYKDRFRTLNDGTIRRWKEGKRHNAHLKSKKSKRRLRQPAIVPAAYAKVMKKLNFCG